MAHTFSVTIPTTQHLRQFIIAEFGNPIPINNNSFIGTSIICLLSKQNFNTRLTPDHIDCRFKKFNTSITVVAPLMLMKDYGYIITKDQVIQFNRFFENYFTTQLYFFVQRLINEKERYSGYKEAIHSFASHYNITIEETITYEALKKMEYRYRVRKKEKSFAEMSSPKKQQQLLF